MVVQVDTVKLRDGPQVIEMVQILHHVIPPYITEAENRVMPPCNILKFSSPLQLLHP